MEATLKDRWWYYTVQDADGSWLQGIYEDDMVLLPRLNLSKIDLSGQSAVDVATMEGLMPVLMVKGGAARVAALDFERPGAPTEGNDTITGNMLKLEYVKRLHSVHYKALVVPEKGTAFQTLSEHGMAQFDVLNLSGLLYHVYSPMHWMGSVRPLIKNGGLAIISTNVIVSPTMCMEFNAGGRLQRNLTTYWYLSVPFMDYLLRYFRLRPIRAEFFEENVALGYMGNTPQVGYLSVVCRAEESVVADDGDAWIQDSAWHSWDSKWYGGLEMAGHAEVSRVRFRDGLEFRPTDSERGLLRADAQGRPRLDLWRFVTSGIHQHRGGNDAFTARLALTDQE